jgi:hypothetical protein
MLDPARTDSSDSLAFEQTDALLCSRWEAYGLKETWEMADNSYHNVVFTKNMSLAKTPELFVTKAGEMSTRNEPPRGCYQLPKERREQYSAYKTK